MIAKLRSLLGLDGPAAVLSTRDKLDAGSALAAKALSTFDAIVDDLIEANGILTDTKEEAAETVERIRAEAEARIAEYTALAEQAIQAHAKNSAVIGNVRRLTGASLG